MYNLYDFRKLLFICNNSSSFVVIIVDRILVSRWSFPKMRLGEILGKTNFDENLVL